VIHLTVNFFMYSKVTVKTK